MKAKKIISFCSMFSLVLILSVYYVLSPIQISDQSVSDIENNEGGAFNVNGITLDFINYNKESVDVLRSFIPRIRLSIIRLIAC
jgi:hypothetical protein